MPPTLAFCSYGERVQITHKFVEDDELVTARGVMRWVEWAKRERERLLRSGNWKDLTLEKDGKSVALWGTWVGRAS